MKHANIAIFVPHVGCPHQCSFCNQNAITGAQALPRGRDVARIAAEAAKGLAGKAREAEIAFFGGSFTAVERAYMEELLCAAHPFVESGAFSGIRVSTRPDAVDDERLLLLRRYGVTAVELGAQSMDDRVLALNGRGHTARDVEEASRRIRAHGLSLGLQMMTGLYGDTEAGARDTAERLLRLSPDTVRIYPTVVMRGTALARLYQTGAYCPMPLDGAVTLCAGLLRRFVQSGVKVIRLGLHSTPQLQAELLAGPYHPAFRELCESRLLRGSILDALEKAGVRDAVVRVHPRDRSKAAGQRRENLAYFQNRGYAVQLKGDEAVPQGACAVEARPKEVESR